MAAHRGRNEGIRMLGDFVCQAIPGPGICVDGPAGRGVNEGAKNVAECVVNGPQGLLTDERKSDLRKLSTVQLHSLVRTGAAEMFTSELEFIHELALERLAKPDDPFAQGAEELSREVMQIALRRIG